jgi:VWFA-related protein
VAEDDTVTLVASAGSAWWTARMPGGRDQLLTILKRLDGRYIPDSSPDRITEYEAMRIEVYQDEQMAWQIERRFDAYGTVGKEKDPRGTRPADAVGSTPGLIPSVIRQRAMETYLLATSRNKITLRVMERAIQALAGTRGRKSMILVSQGFIYDLQLDEMKDVVDASRRVNVPIYFVDTRGLQALPEAFTAAFGRPLEAQDTMAVLADLTREAEGSEAVALDTGGFVVKNSNDLAAGMSRVSSESRTYYLLGYTPSDLTRDGKFRRIEVKLLGPKGKGLSVRARRGYFAPRGVTAPKKSAVTRELPDVVRALDSPFEVPDVPLRVASYAFDEQMLDRLDTRIVTEVDIRDLQLTNVDGRAKGDLAFLIEAQHLETGEYYRYEQTIEMSMLPETRDRLFRTWYQVAREFTLPPGGYQAKVVVRDMATGRLGSVMHAFQVPTAGGFRLSTPILSDTLDRSGGPQGAAKPVLRVRPVFAPGSTLYCQFAVFGAKKEETGAFMPRVSSSYEIRRADGRVFKRSSPTRINPTSLGALLRLSGIALAGAEPGEYLLILSVKDELAGQSLEVREPFVVEAG